MSDLITLANVLKSATEATSLESTDRILAFDANGNLKKISRSQTATPTKGSINIENAQWIRIGSFPSHGSLLLSITSSWNHSPGLHVLVDMFLHSNSDTYNDAKVLSRLVNATTSVLSKIRVVRKTNSICYVDIYYNVNTGNNFSVSVIHTNCFTLLPDFELGAEIPDGYTVKEFSLDSVSVGGG